MRRLVVLVLGVAVIAALIWWFTRASEESRAVAPAESHHAMIVMQGQVLADGGVITLPHTSCDARLHGVVTDLVGGGPIDHAEVKVGTALAITGDDGAYELCVANAYATIDVSSEGFALRHAEIFVARDTRQDFSLAAETVVTGTVIMGATKQPAPRVEVSIMAAYGGERVTGVTDDRGRFELHRVASGRFAAWASSDGSLTTRSHYGTAHPGETIALPAPLELVPGPADPRTIDPHSATLVGHTTRNGAPIGGVAVTVPYERTVSAEDGSYKLGNLAPGTYAVSAELSSVAFTKNHSITVKADEQKTLDLELDLAGTIRGVVVDQTDAPVPGARVSFSMFGDRDYGNATTRDDGSFSATAMAGGGSYFVEIRGQDRNVMAPAGGTRFPKIALANGATTVDVGKLRVRTESLSITGRVIDRDGKPVIDLPVQAMLKRGMPVTTSTDRVGAFTIDHLHSGTYSVSARGDGGLVTIEAQAGARDLVLRTPEPGAIEIHLDGFTGARVTIYGEALTQDVVIDHDYTLHDVPIGRYHVTVSDSQFVQPVEVSAGSTSRVTLRQPGRGTLIVHTVMDGSPVPAVCSIDALDVPTTNGVARLTNLVAATVHVSCSDIDDPAVFGTIATEVTANQATDVTVSLVRISHHDPGMKLETQFEEVVVSSVTPDGPASRANIRAGDIVISCNGHAMRVWMTADINDAPTNTLELERDGKTFTVTITSP